MNTTGRLSELRVAADLVARGYEVFLQFGNNSCDMIALKDGRGHRVEVKSGTMRNGKVSKIHKLDTTAHDLLATVFGDVIQYLPDSPPL